MWRRAPVTTFLLIVIAVVCAVEFRMHAFDNNELLMRLGANVPGALQRGEYWRLLTAMFLHGSLLHWLVNSWSLFQLGTFYEALFGSRRFAFVYFVSGIVASAASSTFTHAISVGASGAILGVVGAFIFSILRSPKYRHERWGRDFIGQLVFWIIVNIFIGFSVTFIDNVAHVAGLITGLLLGFIPHRVPPPPPQQQIVNVQPYDEM